MISFVRKPKEKMFWWYTHLGNFIGSYIAAWTAFSVVTLPRILPHAGFVLWLWPTVIGVPAIYDHDYLLQAEVFAEVEAVWRRGDRLIARLSTFSPI